MYIVVKIYHKQKPSYSNIVSWLSVYAKWSFIRFHVLEILEQRERERKRERRGKEEEVEKSPRTQIYTRRSRHLRIDSGDGGINTKA